MVRRVWFHLVGTDGAVSGKFDHDDVVDDLRDRVIKEKYSTTLKGVERWQLQIFPAGSDPTNPINDVDPMDVSSALPTDTTSENPLIVVAPAPQIGLVEPSSPKRQKLRDSITETTQAPRRNHCSITLNTNKSKILTLDDENTEHVRYYFRDGMEELFRQLLDSRENEKKTSTLNLLVLPVLGKVTWFGL